MLHGIAIGIGIVNMTDLTDSDLGERWRRGRCARTHVLLALLSYAGLGTLGWLLWWRLG